MAAQHRHTWASIAVVLFVPAILAATFPFMYLWIFNGIPNPWLRYGTPDANLNARIEILHNYGRDALNNLKLVNGGAIIAILTFLGHMFSSERLDRLARKRLAEGMVFAMIGYSAGLTVSVFSGFLWFSEMLKFQSEKAHPLLLVAIYFEVAGLFYFVAGTFFAALAFRTFSDSEELTDRPDPEGAS